MSKKFCFVAMPFGEGTEYDGGERESAFVYEQIIKPSAARAVERIRTTHGDVDYNELEVVRELETVGSGDITQSIIRHLAEAHVTIVDLTGRNPNVFFELGVRFALKRNGTILLTQDRSQVPFNVQQFRVVEYDPRFDGISRAIDRLSEAMHAALVTLAAPPTQNTDSLIFQALQQLKVSGPGMTEEAPSHTGDISWDEYWARTTHIERELSALRATGAYLPDVLVGISNGGLFLADTCLRLVYANSIPIICLWAQRSQEQYFANPINDAVLSGEVFAELRESAGAADRPLRVLVMDDIVGTQRTFTQLDEYFTARLGREAREEIDLKFVFLYTAREENLAKLQGVRLSADTEVARKYKHVELEQLTRASQLPYRKNIHYGDIAPRATDAGELTLASPAADGPHLTEVTTNGSSER